MIRKYAKKKGSSIPLHVSNVYKDLLQTLGLEKRYFYDQALRMWASVAGDYFSSHTRPIRIENGKLIIAVDDASIRQELHFKKLEIMMEINKALGQEVVREIVLR